jgi:hypothetical protein
MAKPKTEPRYVCLHRSIWNDDKFPFVFDACQLVFFHVMSNPIGYLGVYKASIEALAAEKRKDVKGVPEGLRGVPQGRLLRVRREIPRHLHP